jgi:hypothetical protein
MGQGFQWICSEQPIISSFRQIKAMLPVNFGMGSACGMGEAFQ